MTSSTFFFFFIPLLAFILLSVNFLLAPHNPYQEKNGTFECGFTSFLGQNRTQFSISFFIFALLFLLFDLEILLVYPYLVSSYNNESYGLVILLIFLAALTLGFVFELGKKALNIDSRQTNLMEVIIYNVNRSTCISWDTGISMTIYQNIVSYILIHSDILFTYFISILSHYLIKLVKPDLSSLIRQPLLAILSQQLIISCFVTILYSIYMGYYYREQHTLILIYNFCLSMCDHRSWRRF